jgi:hypothetical protein
LLKPISFCTSFQSLDRKGSTPIYQRKAFGIGQVAFDRRKAFFDGRRSDLPLFLSGEFFEGISPSDWHNSGAISSDGDLADIYFPIPTASACSQ